MAFNAFYAGDSEGVGICNRAHSSFVSNVIDSIRLATTKEEVAATISQINMFDKLFCGSTGMLYKPLVGVNESTLPQPR